VLGCCEYGSEFLGTKEKGLGTWLAEWILASEGGLCPIDVTAESGHRNIAFCIDTSSPQGSLRVAESVPFTNRSHLYKIFWRWDIQTDVDLMGSNHIPSYLWPCSHSSCYEQTTELAVTIPWSIFPLPSPPHRFLPLPEHCNTLKAFTSITVQIRPS
jgi:hypothetical protein